MMCRLPVPAEAEDTVGINMVLLISILLGSDIQMNLTFWQHRPNRCFFVNLVNKPGWSSVVAVRPRNLFAMPEAENEGDMEVDLLDVGIQDMNLLGPNEDLSNWTRPDKEGTTGDASIINQVHGKVVLEPNDAVLLDEDDDAEDDTYIDDGVVALVAVESIEDDFFV